MNNTHDTSMNYELYLQDRPVAVLTQEECDIVACIAAFERGCKNVYLVDDYGRYTGIAISRESFITLWDSETGNVVVTIPWIYQSQDRQLEFSPEDMEQILEMLKCQPDLEEVPIVDEMGHIFSLLRFVKQGEYETSDMHHLPWNQWTDWHVPLTFLLSYRKLYISSLEDPNVRSFYRYYASGLSVELLSSDNLSDALYADDVLLIYGLDIYPKSVNKMDVVSLFYKINHQAWMIIYHELYIEHGEVAVLKENQLHDLEYIVYLLDQGHQVINVVNQSNDFYGIITETDVRDNFPSTEIPIKKNVLIPYSEDESAVKNKMMELYLQAGPEIPIIHDSKIMGLCIRGNHFAGKRRKYAFDMQSLHWELISDDVMLQFFNKSQKILLSSATPDLKGLGVRLTACGIKVTYFANAFLSDYLAGKFDLLLYGSDVWSIKMSPSYDVRKVYANMLVEEIRRYLTTRNVSFYYFDIDAEPAMVDCRFEIMPVPTQPTVTIGGERAVYTVYMDSMSGNGFHTAGGKRITIGNQSVNCHVVHLFGPCTVVGTFTEHDEDTVASRLQQIINYAELSYNVINYGNPGEMSISSLNRIMDTPMQAGDIVVLFGRDLYTDMPVFSVKPHHSLKEIFDSDNYRCGKPFFDLTPHLTPLGNQMLAEYLFHLLKEDMEKGVSLDPTYVNPLAEGLKAEVNCDEGLNDYLVMLNEHKIVADSIGAIVMNCNPFTRGHKYLIERALEQVDYLYVFVVEEDSSAISFQDRFAMVNANCKGSSRLLVLPSGRYMISRITFSAYFSKDDLQDQTVVPADDVRIFGKYIAPCLGIKKRFVGEEPLDRVTHQYNEAMKMMLPQYGIEIVEIPRLRDTFQKPINATMVRENIMEGKLELCRPYLTDTTYQYIEQNFARIRQRIIKYATRN